jgi:hypothetical protein
VYILPVPDRHRPWKQTLEIPGEMAWDPMNLKQYWISVDLMELAGSHDTPLQQSREEEWIQEPEYGVYDSVQMQGNS